MKFGLSPLVIKANTHKIWLVVFPQAKLIWPGSDATLGFWQAVVISLWTVATLGGQDGLVRNSKNDAMATTTARPAPASMSLCERGLRVRVALRRPRSMSVCVRSLAGGSARPECGQPGRVPVRMMAVRSSS